MRARSYAHALRFELVRAFATPRWVMAALTWVLVGRLGSESIESTIRNGTAVDWSVFDVHAAAINSSFNVGLLLLTAFVLIAGDGVGRDRQSRYVEMTVPRTGDKRRWWSVKVCVLLASALVFHAGFLFACVGVGAFGGARMTTAPSGFAVSEGTAIGQSQMLFAPVDPHANMLVREVARAGYLTLTFFAVGVVCMLASLRHPSPWVPAGLCLVYVLLDWVAGYFLGDWYRQVGLVGRMLEGIHSPVMASPALSWSSSLIVFATMAAVAHTVGRTLVTRMDL